MPSVNLFAYAALDLRYRGTPRSPASRLAFNDRPDLAGLLQFRMLTRDLHPPEHYGPDGELLFPYDRPDYPFPEPRDVPVPAPSECPPNSPADPPHLPLRRSPNLPPTKPRPRVYNREFKGKLPGIGCYHTRSGVLRLGTAKSFLYFQPLGMVG
jgi:hypothetical protein